MSKFGKFKEILNIGSAVAKPFVPGAAGSILEKVNEGLQGVSTGAGTDAVKNLAAKVDEYNNQQDEAILALHKRLQALEAERGK